jgi:hypothetical protein
MPKKNENQNKSLQSECLVKFALRNVVLNEFSLFDIYQLWEHLLKQIINDKFNHP